MHFHYLPLLRNLSSHDGLDGKESCVALWEIPQALDPTVTRRFATTPKILLLKCNLRLCICKTKNRNESLHTLTAQDISS